MEIFKSRYGSERVIHKVDANRLRIQGESLFSRTATDDSGNITMFDFEGGPVLSVGGNVRFGHMKWKIKSIQPITTDKDNLAECILEVEANY
jgi:hypothetical protein